jgi:hypothetical protein
MSAQASRKARREAEIRQALTEATPSGGKLLDDYLTAQELTEQLGITLVTLKRWNRLGAGPPFLHIGRQRLYHREAARAWLRSREKQSSVEMPA